MANEKRLIDAYKLEDLLRSNSARYHHKDDVIAAIAGQPTVDAVPAVHGQWEYGKWEYGHWVKGNERCRCSVCHRDFAVDNQNIWNGCPHCLAKMDMLNITDQATKALKMMGRKAHGGE